MFTEDEMIEALHGFAVSIGGSPRVGQDAMARAVWRAIHEDEHVVFDAPTGSGKSLALMFPMLMSGKKGQIGTGTKALQDQYLRDAPKVIAYLDEHFPRPDGRKRSVATIKGKNAYQCRELLAKGEGDPAETAKIREWAETHPTGEWDFVPFPVSAATKAALTISDDDCDGRHCDHFETCFAYLAKDRAQKADLVVPNHALIGIGLMLPVLPYADVIAIDECHELEETVADKLGHELWARMRRNQATSTLTALAQRIGALYDVEDAKKLAQVGSKVAEEMLRVGEHLASKRRESPLLKNGLRDEDALRTHLLETVGILERLEVKLKALPITDPKTKAKRNKLLRSIRKVAAGIEAMDDPARGSTVFWETSQDRNGNLETKLRLVSVLVAEPLHEKMWTVPEEDDSFEDEDDEEFTAARRKRAVVCCSGTVPSTLAADLGLEDPIIEKVPSPFDPERVRLYVPSHLPNPSGQGAGRHQEAAIVEAIRLVKAARDAGGGALVLCTSLASAKAFGAAIELGVPDVPVRVQRFSDEKNELVAWAMSEQTFCLVGSQGLYTGVDLPGKLRAVVIDKAPMAPMDAPIPKAKEDLAGRNGFNKVRVPATAAKLGQAAGRLQRKLDDWGVIAILDPRLRTADWGRGLWSKLPIDRADAIDSLAEAEAFLANGAPPLREPSPIPVPIVAPVPAEVRTEAAPVASVRPAPENPVSARQLPSKLPLSKDIPVPSGRYGVVGDTGRIWLFDVEHVDRPGDRWHGFRFIKQLIGGGLERLDKANSIRYLLAIAEDLDEARRLYGEATGRCAARDGSGNPCERLLTTPDSVERGVGPVCWKRLHGEIIHEEDDAASAA